MTKRFAWAMLITFTVLFAAHTAEAQCASNADCKGGRVCANGACTVAAPAPQPAPAAAPAVQPCRVDNDCPGDAVCEAGQCAAPVPAAPAPAPAPGYYPAPAPGYPAPAPGYPAPAPGYAPPPAVPPPAGPTEISSFQKGYGEISMLLNFHYFGTATYEIEDYEGDDPTFKTSAKVTGGVRLAGYAALAKAFHLGAYFSIQAGEGEMEGDNDEGEAYCDMANCKEEQDLKMWSIGAALKAGGQAGQRLFIGFGLDVGVGWFRSEGWEDDDDLDNDTALAFYLFPRLALDILLLDVKGFRLSLPIGVGVQIMPVGKLEALEGKGDDPEVNFKMFSIGPAMTVGLAFGS